jgi:hypothetical protein
VGNNFYEPEVRPSIERLLRRTLVRSVRVSSTLRFLIKSILLFEYMSLKNLSMERNKIDRVKEILDIQFHLPELDILRNEIGKCFEINAHHACIMLTNLLLERYCKLVLIYKATGFKSIQNLKDLEKDFKPANKKYSTMSLGETLLECKKEGIINESAYEYFKEIKLRFRDGFSHADTSMILKGQTGNFAFGKLDGSQPLEMKKMVIQNIPPLHGIAVQLFAETNSIGYFISVENLIRSTLRDYINDNFETDLQLIRPEQSVGEN